MNDEKQLAITESELPQLHEEPESVTIPEVPDEEKYLAFVTKVVALTKPHHWEIWGYKDNKTGEDKRYARLNRHGAEFIANAAGVTIEYGDPSKEYDPESNRFGHRHYRYFVPVTALWRGRSFEYIGSCDSRDMFLGTNFDAVWTEPDLKRALQYKKWSQKFKDQYYDERIGKPKKPLAKVNDCRILQKAQANGIGNAIGRLFGVHYLPIELFEEKTQLQIAEVSFAGR